MVGLKEFTIMKSGFSPQLTRPLDVLVLDDDYRWRYLIASHVESHMGKEPILASRGAEALDLMSMRPVDVVICDLLMPGMDGLQFLEKAHEQFPRTKIIVLSADFGAFPITPDRLMTQGALAVIPKGEIFSTLMDLLRLLQEVPEARVLHPYWNSQSQSYGSYAN
jgi:DNA-binding NarL/FixJ family response regulator